MLDKSRKTSHNKGMNNKEFNFKVSILILKVVALFFVYWAINSHAGQTVNLAGTNPVQMHKHLDLSKGHVIVLEGRVEMWKMKALADKLSGAKVVHLVINSPGGSVAAGLEFINRVESLRNQGKLKRLQCYIKDMAASMGAIISSYCDGVLIHKYGFFMIHEASYGCMGLQSEVRKCVDFNDKWYKQIEEQVAKNYGLSHFRYLLFQGVERYLIAKEAVGYGFANAVFDSLYHEGFVPKPPKRRGRSLFGGTSHERK